MSAPAARPLRARLLEGADFLVGVELVSIRGSLGEARGVKARELGEQLAASPLVDWVSITDNAGGNPQLAPQALGTPIVRAGKEVVIHLTCKDQNRNGLESTAWQLDSEGFHNVLALTGDYPSGGNGGTAKPVFDLDSVGLICLLDKMNRGFDDGRPRTAFCIGAVVSNHKRREGEVVPQYLKLRAKLACGAHFVVNQVGYDARKARELRRWMDAAGVGTTPLVGNVYVLTARAARAFHEGRIPGIVVTRALLEACERRGASPDGGRAFFHELAAKQVAVFRGLGYRGAYLGGIRDLAAVEDILAIERSFAPDDWRAFARGIAWGEDGEFFLYPAEEEGAGAPVRTAAARPRAGLHYALSKRVHGALFTQGRPLARWGAAVCRRARDSAQGPAALRLAERVGKAVLYRCRDCGDCSLPEVAFLCPESQCPKNQRNGPCGGSRDGRCEVEPARACVWLRAYERRAADGTAVALLAHAPVVQDQGLRGTSSWANFWLGRDHAAHPLAQPGERPAS